MLEVKNLYAGYSEKPIVKDISFKLNECEITCILGENGSGKSTLLKAICNIIKYSGDILINNQSLKFLGRKEIARFISLMAGMNISHFPYTVFQTVLLSRYAHGEKRLFAPSFTKEDTQIVNASLEELHILHLKDRFIGELSSGQMQKVFLARALAQEAKVLLLDEPTSHLDLKAQLEIAELLMEVKQKRNLTILAVLHDINLALQTADRIILIKDGTLFENSLCQNLSLESLNAVYSTDVISYMQKSLSIWKK